MSTDKLKAYNTQIKTLLDNKDYQNADLKKLLKIQKVNFHLCSLWYTAFQILKLNPNNFW